MPEPVSIEAVRQRAERTWGYVEQFGVAPIPSPVRMHFERDLPALVAELERVRPLRDAAVAWAGAKRAADTAKPGARNDLLRALLRADDALEQAALEQAALAALEGQPEGSVP